MPIISYLAFPAPGRFDQLEGALNALPGCETLPADGQELLVLVTDTADEREEKELQKQLRELDSLASLALVYARSDADAPAAAREASC